MFADWGFTFRTGTPIINRLKTVVGLSEQDGRLFYCLQGKKRSKESIQKKPFIE